MIVRGVLKFLIVIVSVSAIAGAAIRVYPQTLIATSLLLRHGPAYRFSFSEVSQAAARHSAWFRAVQELWPRIHMSERSAAAQLVETPFGRYMEPHVNGSNVVAQLAELETKYSGMKDSFVHRGDVVLDCGANVGTFTRAALNAGAAQVIAVEPSPRNLACLRSNLAREIADGRVIVAPVGVWDKDDILTLTESDAPPEDGFVRDMKGHKGAAVPLTTIDKLVTKYGLGRVDFIKLDIEGAEKRALVGARETIARFRPRLEISVNHLPEDPDQVPAIVLRAWPRYRVRLLTCQLRKEDWRIVPEILLFESDGGR